MGVAVEKQQPGQLRILALESPGGTYDENFLSNYFFNNLRPAILRIQGVGKCEVWGGQNALRIWLRPEAMARYGIVPSDITTLLEEQNVEASTVIDGKFIGLPLDDINEDDKTDTRIEAWIAAISPALDL